MLPATRFLATLGSEGTPLEAPPQVVRLPSSLLEDDESGELTKVGPRLSPSEILSRMNACDHTSKASEPTIRLASEIRAIADRVLNDDPGEECEHTVLLQVRPRMTTAPFFDPVRAASRAIAPPIVIPTPPPFPMVPPGLGLRLETPAVDRTSVVRTAVPANAAAANAAALKATVIVRRAKKKARRLPWFTMSLGLAILGLCLAAPESPVRAAFDTLVLR